MCLLMLVVAGGALAQDAITPAALKEKGAKMLTKADLEALLPGTTYADEGDKYNLRYANKAGGALDASGTPRFGGGVTNPPWSGAGTWRVSDQGQYCVEYSVMHGGTTKYCMYLWTLGNDYYTTYGRADDAKGKKSQLSK
jgi:hypothetical protein